MVTLEGDVADLDVHGFQIQAGVLVQMLHHARTHGILILGSTIARNRRAGKQRDTEEQRGKQPGRHTRIITLHA